MLTTAEKIAIMQAQADGHAIECKYKSIVGVPDWEPAPHPLRNWDDFDYRVKIDRPTIDWSHVRPDLCWLAIDADGESSLFSMPPQAYNDSREWFTDVGVIVAADAFTSFKPGDCHWRDSLVQRP